MPAPTLPTVLVVDDELRSQEALRRTLDEEFEVFTASSAAEALEILAREWIQIVLTDQRMPGTCSLISQATAEIFAPTAAAKATASSIAAVGVGSG